MYNIKGPSKIVAKTARRGISQNIDNFRDHKNKIVENEEIEITNVPKPTFNKKTSPVVQRSKHLSPQHEEIIHFINESWNSVCAELDQENGDSDETNSPSSQGESSICYYEDEPCLSLQDFKPFDLESWWGKRLYAYVTNSVNAKG
ncbi:MAPK regulated corepressor interacting protein 2 [Leptinotarsa decemlineata]|uniref:MAPK regulated corepressor interacting protein 2 n=1 Tax=Leptinotarsa decemlineata TaxID=7539 RepID=UPI000C254F39|nr:MAPK regulated corepressor interacting protein 2 [Leptinotarsa decemlineata]